METVTSKTIAKDFCSIKTFKQVVELQALDFNKQSFNFILCNLD